MVVSRQGEDKRRRIRKYQQRLEETRVLLQQLRNRRGTPQATKDDINDVVGELEQIKRDLPDLIASPDFLEVVLGFLKKVYGIWRSIRGG